MPNRLSAVTPVIPEQITVHLGAPDQPARNVTVSFPDYIKNVASGEIYPTWPESALRANIYAQISFALNRVFLEFYRSQGYDFDITSSTSIDQSFSEGRNIFENISDIVDEIFNSYIKRPATLEPLAAKFCNGTTVTCEGLSQWGSVSLAEQGYVPFDILTYYYGDNLELVRDAPIQNVTESYPGTALRLGDTGQSVTVIQVELNEISNNYPAIPKISPVNGVFDENTEAAVRKFQEIFDLAVDGIVGRQTWYKLVFLYTGINRLSELNSEGVYLRDLTASQAGAAIAAVEYLREGDSGELVLLLQYMLAVISIFYSSVQYVTQTGIFDERTKNSLIGFQQVSGLEPTGVVDYKTWDFLYSAYITIARYFDARGYNFPFLENEKDAVGSVAIGDSGETVKNVQNMLNCIAVHDKSISPVTVTGYFGPKTRDGIIKFQKYSHLSQTGVADRATIMQMSAAQRHHENEVNTSFRQYPGYVLREGMRDSVLQQTLYTNSTPITNLQTMLRFISAAVPDVPTVIPDGIYNERTAAAVRAVQRRLGIEPTGETDYKTWEGIYDEYTVAMLKRSEPLKVSPFPVSNKPILMAESGDYVYFTQIMLNRLADNIYGVKKVEINGMLDDATRADLMEIQKISGLSQTGMLDKNTWNAIVTMYEAVTKGYTVF